MKAPLTPFTVYPPRARETPVVVEVPHAGTYVDEVTQSTLAAPQHVVMRDADLMVDELYADAPDEGATLLASHVSRYVVDLNRAETDIDGETVEGYSSAIKSIRGVVWRISSEGTPALTRKLSRREFETRIRLYYRDYHETLSRLLLEKRDRFGYAILLCGHSMPSVGRAGHNDPNTTRADVVPGTRGRTSAAEEWIDRVDQLARDAGYSVLHDTPYRGGFSTVHYGRPAVNVHAIQIELARRLYMDEATLTRNERFEQTRLFCRTVVRRLGEPQKGDFRAPAK